MRSSLVALRARVYSLALSKGWRAGSRLRGWRATFEPGAWYADVGRVRALTFFFGSVYSHKKKESTYHCGRSLFGAQGARGEQARQRWESRPASSEPTGVFAATGRLCQFMLTFNMNTFQQLSFLKLHIHFFPHPYISITCYYCSSSPNRLPDPLIAG